MSCYKLQKVNAYYTREVFPEFRIRKLGVCVIDD